MEGEFPLSFLAASPLALHVCSQSTVIRYCSQSRNELNGMEYVHQRVEYLCRRNYPYGIPDPRWIYACVSLPPVGKFCAPKTREVQGYVLNLLTRLTIFLHHSNARLCLVCLTFLVLGQTCEFNFQRKYGSITQRRSTSGPYFINQVLANRFQRYR